MPPKKSGINQPLVCKGCGKKIGFLKIKPAFNRKVLMWGLGIAFVTQLVGQFASDILIRIIMNRHI